MDYVSETLKDGIKVHYRNTNKYKTNLITVFLSVPLDKQTVTKNALITSILRLGTKTKPTQEEINKKLEEMYGAEFNCGIEKIGEVQLLKFYIEVLNDEFLPQKENLLEEAINQLLDIIFNPATENNGFIQEYIATEKVNLKNIIESKINDKEQYSFDRCIEEMYKDNPYSIYKYGYVEDLENLSVEDIYNQYKDLIKTAKIDIYVSGKFNQDEIKNTLQNNPNIQKLEARDTQEMLKRTNTVGADDPVCPATETYPDTVGARCTVPIPKGATQYNRRKTKRNPRKTSSRNKHSRQQQRLQIRYSNIQHNTRSKRNFKAISKCKRKSKFSIFCTFSICKTKKRYIH